MRPVNARRNAHEHKQLPGVLSGFPLSRPDARRQTSSQPATCRSGEVAGTVTSAFDQPFPPLSRALLPSCPALANCLPSAGFGEPAHPTGLHQPAFPTVPSHTLSWPMSICDRQAMCQVPCMPLNSPPTHTYTRKSQGKAPARCPFADFPCIALPTLPTLAVLLPPSTVL